MIGIEIDPNGPWHHDDESETTWLVTGVRDRWFGTLLADDDLRVGSMVATYTGQGDPPHENDWAIVQFAVIREIRDVAKDDESYWLIYLELLQGDPASLA